MKIKDNIKLSELLNFKFSKDYSYSGGSIYRGCKKIIKGYEFVVTEETEIDNYIYTTHFTLLIIDKQTREIELFYNNYKEYSNFGSLEQKAKEKIEQLKQANLIED